MERYAAYQRRGWPIRSGQWKESVYQKVRSGYVAVRLQSVP
jgi:hypothetical protein